MPTLYDLKQALDARLHSRQPEVAAARVTVGRVATDSRLVEPGDVFWAIQGAKHDGADFIADAFQRGAVAAVTSRAILPEAEGWVVQVHDSYDALRRYAQWRRHQFTGTLVAVTGSVGKTTTRQMIHAALGRRLTGTASPKNYNNHFGVPLAMLRIERDHDYAVLELGASRRGEIAGLSALCLPKVGVITQVGEAHLGGFGSRQAIAESKAELIAALPREGRAVLGDDPWLRSIASKASAPITWVGVGHDCEVRATDVLSEGGRLRFRVGPQVFEVPVWGRHHLVSALAAIAVGRMLGLDYDELASALAEFEPVPQRCEVVRVRGATIINDTYNASPTAMLAALNLLSEIDLPGRRIVVCGDMAELGDESAELHWQLGRHVAEVGKAQLLIACGQFSRCVVAGARAAGLPRTHTIACANTPDAMPLLGQAIVPGDVVLVKGSRRMAMERVIYALEQYPQRRSA